MSLKLVTIITARGSATNKRMVSTEVLMTGYLTCFVKKFKVAYILKAKVKNNNILLVWHIVKFGHAERPPLFLIWEFFESSDHM